MFVWNNEMARFLRDASEYSDYYTRLAEWIAPYLQPGDRVCDVGCGLGYLSMALSNYVKQITAIDRSEIALDMLRNHPKRAGNISCCCGDIFCDNSGQIYDAMVFSFFGKMEEIALAAKNRCRGEIFAFKKNYGNHRFTAGAYPVGDDSFDRAVDWLRRRGVPFSSETLCLEMGQPLRSREEAYRFFALYHRGDAAEISEAFLNSRLVETGREDFPLYLPQKREVGCLRFRAADLPPVEER